MYFTFIILVAFYYNTEIHVHGSHSDWINGKAFSSQGILLGLEKSGNFTRNSGKSEKVKLEN